MKLIITERLATLFWATNWFLKYLQSKLYIFFQKEPPTDFAGGREEKENNLENCLDFSCQTLKESPVLSRFLRLVDALHLGIFADMILLDSLIFVKYT